MGQDRFHHGYSVCFLYSRTSYIIFGHVLSSHQHTSFPSSPSERGILFQIQSAFPILPEPRGYLKSLLPNPTSHQKQGVTFALILTSATSRKNSPACLWGQLNGPSHHREKQQLGFVHFLYHHWSLQVKSSWSARLKLRPKSALDSTGRPPYVSFHLLKDGLICSRYSIRNNSARLCQLQAIKLMNLYTSIEHYDRGQATSSVVSQTQGTMGLCKALESWLWVWRCHWEHGQPSLLKDASLLGITAPSPSASFTNKLYVYPLGSIPMSLLPGPACKDTGPRRSAVSVPLPIPSHVCGSLASCSSSPLAHIIYVK